MKFTIAKTPLQTGTVPEQVVKIQKFLERLPNGELLTFDEMEAQARMCRASLVKYKRHPAMSDYWTLGLVRGTHIVLFGNPKTIKAYNKEFNHED